MTNRAIRHLIWSKRGITVVQFPSACDLVNPYHGAVVGEAAVSRRKKLIGQFAALAEQMKNRRGLICEQHRWIVAQFSTLVLQCPWEGHVDKPHHVGRANVGHPVTSSPWHQTLWGAAEEVDGGLGV